jgi:hypothetical protein
MRWWNKNARRRRQVALSLNAVSEAFFDCILNEDYHKRHYFYERRLHVAKRSLMQAVLAWPAGSQLLARLLQVIILRTRVFDLAEFELCALELRELRAALSVCFAALGSGKGEQVALPCLVAGINQFEGINEHVLKVSARDPSVYVFFLMALNDLRLALTHEKEAR